MLTKAQYEPQSARVARWIWMLSDMIMSIKVLYLGQEERGAGLVLALGDQHSADTCCGGQRRP